MTFRWRTLWPALLVLLLGGCWSPATYRGPEPPGAAPPAPATAEAAEADVHAFFAAFEQVVLTGDEDYWLQRSSPDCFFCVTMAETGAGFGFGAGLQDGDVRSLAGADLSGYDVTTLAAALDGDDGAVVDVRLELGIVGLALVPPEMVAPDGTVDVREMAAEEGAHRARVHLSHDGTRWVVDDVTRMPGDAGVASLNADPEQAEALAGRDEMPTVEDAVAVAQRFLDLEREVARTGETSEIEALIGPDCAGCRARVRLAQERYASVDEYIGGRSDVELLRQIPHEEIFDTTGVDEALLQRIFLLDTLVHQDRTVRRSPDGDVVAPATTHGLVVALYLDDQDRWELDSMMEAP
ncbi:hypothetical protein [Isoptericola haloaureus]|uniref:Uncharacterized protein n=1 Tax=Isoptericola haloaureus TaxID=1542902 RepID=A0ABU7Z6L6_9MICO